MRWRLVATASLGLASMVAGSAQSSDNDAATDEGVVPAGEASDADGSASVIPQVVVGDNEDDRRFTISSSGQFVVHGDAGVMRSDIAALAERVRGNFLEFLGDRNARWGVQIVVRVLPDDGGDGGVLLRVEVVDNHSYLLTIFAKPGAEYNERRMTEVLVQSLILEQGLRRANPDEVHDGDLLPEWLWRGVVEAMAFRRDRQRTELFKAMMRGESLMSVGELLDKNPAELTQVGRRIYNASTGALVLTLMHQINGPTRFSLLLEDLPFAEVGPKELIQRHFQNIDIDNAELEKWWALEVASMAQPKARDHWSPEQSAREIRSSLRLVYLVEGEGGDVTKDIPISSLLEIEDQSDRRRALISIRARLMALQPMIHPAYRSLVRDLINSTTELLKKRRRKRADEKTLATIDELVKDGEFLTHRIDGISDVLNWLEVLHQGEVEADPFAPFFNVLDELRSTSTNRKDQITGYLDVIEHEFARD